MKAISLISGGLDSTLAAKLILDQGIEVIGVNFISPFCLCDGRNGCKKKSIEVVEELGIKLKILPIHNEYLEMVKNPKYGYGKNLNPCIDCRILMLKKAKEFMENINASFIITGEVLGQRPMSQNRKAIQIIEKESGLEGLIVRPLSAKFLPPSIPEKEGWISRDKLLNIIGRSRKMQLALAKQYKINNFKCAAGGCLLTDPIFSKIVEDLIRSNMLTIENVNLIKNGRYFRITDSFKLVVGRNQSENQKLLHLAKTGDLVIESEEKGPVAIGRGKFSDKELELSLKIARYYCKIESAKIYYWIPPDKIKNSVIIYDRLDTQEILNYRIRDKLSHS